MGTIGRTSNNNIARTTTTSGTTGAAAPAKTATPATAKPANTVKDGFDTKASNSAVRTAAPAAVFTAPAGAKDKAYDGKIMGKGGQAFDASTPLSQIPAYEPKGGVKQPGTIIYVNGMMTDKAGQETTMQAIADKTGQKTIGIHNSTEGFFKDLGQCITDKMDKGKNPAVDTLADSLYSELKAGRDVHLMAHSQGGLITSRALNDVAKRLRIEDGLSPAQVQEKLGKVSVETFGAAAATYPDGPKYVHYVNDKDPVPGLFGLGTSGKGPLDLLKHAGKDAKIRYFSEKSIFSGAHNINDTYLNQRVPFDQARAG
ncbi:hypothetical protein D7X30_19735 [Corallococcus sp. AB011P]|uniref:hypothetical protein n=1 Tax=Corallococcus sp. AB011P TaxID=2316735 RepID=UPI000EA0E507|nr:hypothetical protein [Corallococcus sp. AB011P]RKG57717.1 hypothetical protein D7X30_19735 [Corallococcus sp. AB011P]